MAEKKITEIILYEDTWLDEFKDLLVEVISHAQVLLQDIHDGDLNSDTLNSIHKDTQDCRGWLLDELLYMVSEKHARRNLVLQGLKDLGVLDDFLQFSDAEQQQIIKAMLSK